MHFMEPRPLEAGWKKRTFHNGCRLVLRRPVLLLAFLIAPLLVAFHVRSTAAVMLAQILGFLLCAIAAVKANKGSDAPWERLFKNFLRMPGSLGIAVGISVFLYASARLGVSPSTEASISVYALLSFSLLQVLVSFLMLMMTAMVTMAALLMLGVVIRRPLFGQEIGALQFPGLFTHQILIDQGCGMMDAMRLNQMGLDLNKSLPGFFGSLCMLSVLLPLLFGFLGVWLYLVYKEVFFGETGLHEPAKVSKVNSALPASA